MKASGGAASNLQQSVGAVGRLGVLAALSLAILALPPSAGAAPADGAITVATGGKGKAAKLIKRAGVKVRGVRGATGKGKVTLPVRELALAPRLSAELGGALQFRARGRSVRFRSLRLVGRGRRLAITGRLKGGRIPVFRIRGAATGGPGSVALEWLKLRLTGKAAKRLRKRLRARLRAGRIGRLAGAASIRRVAAAPPSAPQGPAPGSCPTALDDPPPIDPPGSVGPPAPLPSLPDPAPLVAGSAIDWGLRASFRAYVGANPGYPPAGTSPILAGGGAGVNGDGSFNWGGTGDYARVTDPGRDQIVIEGSGSIQFCYPSHGFRITIADPTIVIDPEGGDGRIVLDIGTSFFGTDYPSRRVDFAALDLEGLRPAYSEGGTLATWSGVPASLTADGAEAFGGFYAEGTPLDTVTVTARTATAPDPFADVCPIAPGAGDGPAPAAAAAPIGPLPGAVPAAGGGASWGFKDSFQSYVWLVPPAGTVAAINGAGFDGVAPALPGDFALGFAAGQYSDGGTPADLTDDAAVLEATGGGLFCKQGHSLRIAFGQLAVVIDGEDSRIVADADANLFGNTQGAQRVTIAELDADGVTPTESGGAITWAGIPAALTEDGVDALGFQGFYAPGEPLEPITVTVEPE